MSRYRFLRRLGACIASALLAGSAYADSNQAAIAGLFGETAPVARAVLDAVRAAGAMPSSPLPTMVAVILWDEPGKTTQAPPQSRPPANSSRTVQATAGQR